MKHINEYGIWSYTPQLKELEDKMEVLFKECNSPEEIVELSAILHQILNGVHSMRVIDFCLSLQKTKRGG